MKKKCTHTKKLNNKRGTISIEHEEVRRSKQSLETKTKKSKGRTSFHA